MICDHCLTEFKSSKYKRYCSQSCMYNHRDKRKINCDSCGKMVIEIDRLLNKEKKYKHVDKWRLCFDCLIEKKKKELHERV